MAREVKERPLVRSDVAGRNGDDERDGGPGSEADRISPARDAGVFRPLGDPEVLPAPATGSTMNKRRPGHVIGSRDRVMIIRGVAGTGKTTLEQEIGEAPWPKPGRLRWRMAQSVRAKEGCGKRRASIMSIR